MPIFAAETANKLRTTMKRILLVTAILMANVLSMSAAKKTVIDRIEPTDWYVGMKNPQVRLDSPNYLLVYMNLSGAQPGIMTLNFGKTKVQYQLKQREMSGDKRMGFTNADVLYMLMPDRFAQGANHPTKINGMRNYVEDRTKPSLRHGASAMRLIRRA